MRHGAELPMTTTNSTDTSATAQRAVTSGPLVRRVCETCDNWSRDRMRCDYEPEEPCPPDCSCDGWTAVEPDTPAAVMAEADKLEELIQLRLENPGMTREAALEWAMEMRRLYSPNNPISHAEDQP